jgi:short-subunit dehydrogenase
VVVTGAGSGIGRATAIALAAAGATVVAVDRDAAALAAVTERTGGTAVEADVTTVDHAARVVAAALERHGRLDAVVANAGIGYVGSFADMPIEKIVALLDTNLRAPMLLIHAALPALRAHPRPASIVITSSIGGALPVADEAAYGVSKTALESFADALREELHGSQIVVSTIRPGVVATAFHDSRNEPYTRSFPRPVRPERVAAAILDMMRSGTERRTLPRWLNIAVRARSSFPWLYRTLARRFG